MWLTTLFLSALLAVSQGRVVGHGDVSTRIVNGTNAKIGELPFQVSLQHDNYLHFCGGSILNENYVITAAHCIYFLEDAINIVVGTLNSSKPLYTHKSVKIIVHEKFDIFGATYDIGLIKVEPSFKFAKLVSPIPLTKPSDRIATNSTAFVSGWGYLGGMIPEVSEILQVAKLYITDQEFCRSAIEEIGAEVYPNNICAYDPNTRRGQCTEDAGGPLTVNGKLAGIVSWSVKDPFCGSTKYPAVFTRVSEYIDWISKNAV